MAQRISPSVSGAIRTFSLWLANGTVARPLLEGIDYSCIFREPSALEPVHPKVRDAGVGRAGV